MSLALDGPTQPHGRAPRPRESGWGTLAVAASLIGFAALVCAATGLSLADHIPSPLDRYHPTVPGQTSLYRVQYANGSQGFATTNVVKPSVDSVTYVRAYATSYSMPVQVHTSYTNWLGAGADHSRDDYYGRDTDHLVLIAELEAGVTTLLTPPILEWAPALLSSSQATPVTSAVSFNGLSLNYVTWRAPNETLSLPGGAPQAALRVESELRRDQTVLNHVSAWYVAGVGLVRNILVDGQGRPLERYDLLASTELPRSASAASALPPADLQTGGPSASAFFRENAARTGAQPDAKLDAASLNVTYRLQTRIPFSASPVFANGLFYAADQNGQLAALDAYQATPHWRFSAGGPIVAAPAVAAGIVYVAAGDKTLYALDAAHGMYLWSFRFKDNIAASPVVTNGLLYIGGEDRTLYALDALTGMPRWSFVAGDRLVGSAAVAGGRVIFGCDDALVYALDAATGKLLWRYAMDGPVEATPLVDAAGVVYAASNKTEMAAIAAENGAQIWNTSTRFGYLASPALGNGLILAADTGGMLRAYNAHTGAIVWEKHAPGAQEFASSPLVLAGQVLAADTSGTVTVWDNASGKLLRQIAVGSALTGSPTWTGDAVLLADSAGELLALQSAPSVRSLTLNPVWQHTFDSGNNPNIFAASLFAQPILSGNSLIAVLSGGGMWSVDSKTGAATRLADLGDGVSGNLALAGDVMIAGMEHGQVAAYKIGQGAPLWHSKLEGAIRFGPAVGDQRVFVNSFTAKESLVTALDLATGKVLWTQRYSTGSGTPVFDQGKLYIAADAILALDPATGETLWRSAPFVAAGSLAVYDGTVYAASSAGQGVTFVALDAGSGQPKWQHNEAVRFFYSRPAYDPASQTVLAGADNGQLFAYDAATGQLRWSFQTDGALESDPQVRDGVVTLTSLNGDTYAVDIVTGRLLTNFLPGTSVYTFAAPVVGSGVVFAAHGATLYGLEAPRP